MFDPFLRLFRYAESQCPVILIGPTGTGKSLLAELVHWSSGRAGPFVEITGAELLTDLAEDKLFGHEKGGFTGADRPRKGLLREAGTGTILLDDLHLLPIPMQAHLLRVLQSREFRAIGADRESRMICRIVVGLRDCPDALVREGKLLPDLRYRLGHCEVRVPPLSERRDEIRWLAEAFLRRCPEETGVPGPERISADAMASLVSADWPGNVRHLKSVIEAAYLNADRSSVLDQCHLPQDVNATLRFVRGGERARNDLAIASALARVDDDATKAAELLGVHRNTVVEYRSRLRSGS